MSKKEITGIRKKESSNGDNKEKKGLGSSTANISSLVKAIAGQQDSKTQELQKPEKKVEVITQEPLATQPKEQTDFEIFLEAVKNSDFSMDNVKTVYLDIDLHSLLALLKNKGIPMTKLINSIILEWLNKNQDNVKQIINTKNRYFQRE